MEVYIKDDNNFYKNIKRYKKSKNTIHFLYKDKDIIDDKNINKYDDDIKFKIYCINALNIKDIKERYSYIYDVVCNYLDNKFNTDNICDFKNNRCISVRNNNHCSESKNGCCYGRKRGVCEHLKNNRCNIKSISCKLFTCRHLKKKGIKFKVNDIPLLKYFMNLQQKLIIINSFFKDKDEMIKLLVRYK
ncbi:MAG: hypothetical protein IKG58_01210 [Bacilli bacterium]|nr:hypothetical protein [Bacilli bacterium]